MIKSVHFAQISVTREYHTRTDNISAKSNTKNKAIKGVVKFNGQYNMVCL